MSERARDDIDFTHVEAALRAAIEGRTFIIAGYPTSATTSTVKWLCRLGADRVLVLGSGVGFGPPPAPSPIVTYRQVESRGTPTSERTHRMPEPTESASRFVDEWDSASSAVVLAPGRNERTHYFGRPVWGVRKKAWVDLEDKTRADSLFDRASIRRPDSQITSTTIDELQAASSSLDRGFGVVWAGDASEGPNSGASFVRFIQDDDDSELGACVDFFAAHCRLVRVAPYLPGLPCAIHGMVVNGAVIVFEPVEVLSVRRGSRFIYGGEATYWRPDESVRDVMRDCARRVGSLLSDQFAFAGAFGVDGIASEFDFMPTEINPRFGGGMACMARSTTDHVPLELLNIVAIEFPDKLSSARVEELITGLVRAHPRGIARFQLPGICRSLSRLGLSYVNGNLLPTEWDSASPDLYLSLITSEEETFVSIDCCEDRTPVGPPVRDRVIASLRYATQCGLVLPGGHDSAR